MSQPSVAAFFNTRKRAAIDDAATIKNRHINDINDDGDNVSTSSLDEIAPLKASAATAGARTRSGRLLKRTGVQNPKDVVVPKKLSKKDKTVDNQEQDLIKFIKKGKECKDNVLTPQKSNNEQAKESTIIDSENVLQKANEATPSTNSGNAALLNMLATKDHAANMDKAMRTPTKQIIKGTGNTPMQHSNGELLNLVKKELNFDEVKTKLSRSAKLQELKASLSRIQELEKTRKAQEERNRRLKENLLSPAKKPKPVQLKEFDKIELEVLTR